MKATTLKKDKRYDSRIDKSLNIQTFGDGNDYPQQIIELVDASGTGKTCVSVYSKFISGRGFAGTDFFKLVVNRLKQTNDYLLDQISKDYAKFGGFFLHVNYNANYKIVEVYHQPFEQVRLVKPDEYGHFDKVAIHPDWGKRFSNIKRFDKKDIQEIYLFNSDIDEIQNQVDASGGWHNFKGQVFYFSNSGAKSYSLPIYDSVLTDMNTEEGISNVNNRNARSNFLAAGIVVNIITNNNSLGDNEIESPLADMIKGLQGDENACKVGYAEVERVEDTPKFISLKGENYDKEFEVTNRTIQANIGKAFNQPPILRAENVASGLGADLMINAYDYYNSVTENERLNIERVFTEIFSNWYLNINVDAQIIPLSYNVEITLYERLGELGFNQLLAIIANQGLSKEQKQLMSKRIFNLDDNEINDIIL